MRQTPSNDSQHYPYLPTIQYIKDEDETKTRQHGIAIPRASHVLPCPCPCPCWLVGRARALSALWLILTILCHVYITPKSTVILPHTTIPSREHGIPSALPLVKLDRAGLVVGSVTTGESPVLYVFFFFSSPFLLVCELPMTIAVNVCCW